VRLALLHQLRQLRQYFQLHLHLLLLLNQLRQYYQLRLLRL
jgi:hypothetical protein